MTLRCLHSGRDSSPLRGEPLRAIVLTSSGTRRAALNGSTRPWYLPTDSENRNEARELAPNDPHGYRERSLALSAADLARSSFCISALIKA